ncbi:sodium bile acid cotransporter [Artemisia annua]|uniref:Sodium bile acid cotransporter n=1 Tax=Artemisia annua TaxID=35608 RepID=A0A2U1Q4G0_ARTAN|nr:sodium bile acid cotransporter [Artemisia annua]
MVNIHLQPQEFVTGLALYNCMPTSISSGVALTKLAGGNSALALAMTVLSNLLGILIIMCCIFNVCLFYITITKCIYVGSFFCIKTSCWWSGASIPADKLFKSLIVSILLPLIMGKLFPIFEGPNHNSRVKCDTEQTEFLNNIVGVAYIVDSNRKLFAALGSILLSLIPWVQVSRSRPLLLMVNPEVVLVAVIMGAHLRLSPNQSYQRRKVHIYICRNVHRMLNSLFQVNSTRSSTICISTHVWYSVLEVVPTSLAPMFKAVFTAVLPFFFLIPLFPRLKKLFSIILHTPCKHKHHSNTKDYQKTISMLVAVVEQLGCTFGEAGLLVLPCIAAHISQVIIDSLIVGYWNKEKQSLGKAN